MGKSPGGKEKTTEGSVRGFSDSETDRHNTAQTLVGV
jgi:hypothetical protein